MSGAGPWDKPPGRQTPVLLIVLASVGGTLLLAGGAFWLFQHNAAAEVAATQKSTVPACEERRDQLGFRRAECYTKYAEATAAPELCDALPAGGDVTESRGACVQSVALALGNAALCERVGGDGRSACFGALAGALEDAKLCDKVERPSERDGCYRDLARALKDPEICRRLEQDVERAACLSAAIQVGTDMKVCEMVQGTSGREACLSAVARNELDACLQMPERRRAQCVRDSSQRREVDDLGVPCGGLPDCLIGVAELDITLCERISPSDKTQRARCVESAISGFGNRWVRSSTCDRLQDLGLRDVCFDRVGHGADHESACQRILNVALRGECAEAAKQKLARNP